MSVIKNMVVLNAGAFAFFASYQGLINLQSSINTEGNIGVHALFTKYVFLALSSLILPTFMIQRFSCKSVLVLACVGYIPYAAANFYPIWQMFIPAAVVGGVAAALMWSARATFTNDLVICYVADGKRTQEATSALFFGLNCLFWSLAYVCGNVISFLLLRPNDDQEQPIGTLNCGLKFQEDINNTNQNLEPLSDEKRYTLTGVYMTCFVIAAFLFQFGLSQPPVAKADRSQKSTFALLFASIKHLKNKNQLLLLPLTIHVTMSDGFFYAAYTKAYVACAIGVHEIGSVMATYGIVCGFISAALGTAVKHMGYLCVMTSAAVVQLIIYVVLLTWQSDATDHVAYYLIAAAWAHSDAVWWAAFLAYYGVIFKNSEEAAFSNFYFWNALGFLVSFALQGVLSTEVLIYVLVCNLLLGMAGFLMVDIGIKRRERTKDDIGFQTCNVHEPSITAVQETLT